MTVFVLQAAAPLPSQESSQWQTHYTPEGRPYYFDPNTNVTQWDPPANLMQ